MPNPIITQKIFLEKQLHVSFDLPVFLLTSRAGQERAPFSGAEAEAPLQFSKRGSLLF